MIRRLLLLSVAFLLITAPLSHVSLANARKVQPNPSISEHQPDTLPVQNPNNDKVKREVGRRLGTKKDRVNIKLENGQKLKGRITRAADDRFTVIQDKTGQEMTLMYTDVAKVSGRGISTTTKILIGVGVVVVVVAIIGVIAVRNIDPFSGGITAR